MIIEEKYFLQKKVENKKNFYMREDYNYKYILDENENKNDTNLL